MIGRLLCLLDFHDWKHIWNPAYHKQESKARGIAHAYTGIWYCQRCGRVDWQFTHTKHSYSSVEHIPGIIGNEIKEQIKEYMASVDSTEPQEMLKRTLYDSVRNIGYGVLSVYHLALLVLTLISFLLIALCFLGWLVQLVEKIGI